MLGVVGSKVLSTTPKTVERAYKQLEYDVQLRSTQYELPKTRVHEVPTTGF